MIGIFDSGVGGLSVFREIRKVLPDEKYIYYSDNAHCPYGEKSKEYIIGRARKITRFLLDKGAEIIVVACNTATAAAISTLREEFPVRFIGMEPAVKPAATSTRTGVVGVHSTAFFPPKSPRHTPPNCNPNHQAQQKKQPQEYVATRKGAVQIGRAHV